VQENQVETIMKKLLFLSIILCGFLSTAKAQVSVGMNFQTSDIFLTVGTNPDNEFFGEARLGIDHELGLELMGAYNFVRKSEVNAYVGAGLGLFGDHHHKHHHEDHDDLYFAVPIGIFIKPFTSTKNLGLLVEAAPVFSGHDHNYFRGGVGIKYTFR
jgi:hypothetical protein